MLWRSVLAKRERVRPPNPAPADSGGAGAGANTSDSLFSASAVLGGLERRINSQDFRGGDVTAIMGGCQIDLRGASITPPNQAVLTVFALFGGIEIRIPDDWTI